MSNKRNKNRKAYQKKRATSKCERRNAAKRQELKMKEARQREYLEQKIAEAKAQKAAQEAAKKTVTADDAGNVVVAENTTTEAEPATETSNDIDLSLRWHVVDKDSGDVLATATSRAKAQTASKELEADTKVMDSTK